MADVRTTYTDASSRIRDRDPDPPMTCDAALRTMDRLRSLYPSYTIATDASRSPLARYGVLSGAPPDHDAAAIVLHFDVPSVQRDET